MTKRRLKKARKLYHKIINEYKITIAHYKNLKQLQQTFKGSQLYIWGVKIWKKSKLLHI